MSFARTVELAKERMIQAVLQKDIADSRYRHHMRGPFGMGGQSYNTAIAEANRLGMYDAMKLAEEEYVNALAALKELL